MRLLPTRRWFEIGAALALIGLAGLRWPEALGVLLLADAVWLLALVIDAWRTPSVASLTVTRLAPPGLSVGRSATIRYRWRQSLGRVLTVEARETLPAALDIGTPELRRLSILPGKMVEEVRSLTPARRGRAEGGGFTVRMAGPWGLAVRQSVLPLPWSVSIYPELPPSTRLALPAQVRRRREAGLRAVRILGEGRVFESLREWVPGDDTRTIDWKATARRGRPMARQYEDERRQLVLIVIDAGRQLTAESDGVPRLERVLEAALALAQSAVAQDDNVGLLVFDDQIRQYVAPRRGKAAMRAILDALASVEGRLVEPDYPAAFRHLALRSRRRALTVLFTDVIDRSSSEALLSRMGTLRPRHLPVAVTLRDPALERMALVRPANDAIAYERAAAEELLLERSDALASMRKAGVIVVDVQPAGAADAIVSQYRTLKRKGML
jgi:uncharacterized protein (DUF58 family)